MPVARKDRRGVAMNDYRLSGRMLIFTHGPHVDCMPCAVAQLTLRKVSSAEDNTTAAFLCAQCRLRGRYTMGPVDTAPAP